MLTVLTVHALTNCEILPTTYYVQSSEFIRQSSSAGLQLEFNLLRFSFFFAPFALLWRRQELNKFWT